MYEEYIVFGVTVLFVAYVWRYYMDATFPDEFPDETDTPTHHNASVSCPSPDCVRCLGNKRTMDVALKRYQQFITSCLTRNVDSDQSEVIIRIGKAIREHNVNVDEEKLHRKLHQPTVFFHPRLHCKPYYNWEDIGDANREGLTKLKDNMNLLYQSYTRALRQYPNGWHVNETAKGKWELFPVINQGAMTPLAIQNFPHLCQLLEEDQMFSSILPSNSFGFAGFSIVHPNTSIEPHCGPTNSRLRTHLTLKSGWNTGDRCQLTVDTVCKQWSDSEYLICDDSYEHGVEYSLSNENIHASQPRVVFILDIWHPDITDIEKEMLSYIYKQPTSCDVSNYTTSADHKKEK